MGRWEPVDGERMGDRSAGCETTICKSTQVLEDGRRVVGEPAEGKRGTFGRRAGVTNNRPTFPKKHAERQWPKQDPALRPPTAEGVGKRRAGPASSTRHLRANAFFSRNELGHRQYLRQFFFTKRTRHSSEATTLRAVTL